jgi:RNA polymerase sigma-70 factor (ECF subfamily)
LAASPKLDEDAGDLEHQLEALVDRARTRWPTLTPAPEKFVAYVAARAPRTAIAGWLAEIAAEDLYLAERCLSGDRAAVSELESMLRSVVGRAARRAGLATAAADDLAQELHTRLLVGEHPSLGDYAGRGALRAWLRVVSARTAVRMADAKSAHTELAVTRDELAQVLSDDSPELTAIRGELTDAVKSAFESALAQLTSRERNFLRQVFVYGLGVGDLAALYQIHRVTASRTLTRAKRNLRDGLVDALGTRLDLAEPEVESVLRLLRARIDLSLARLLRTSRQGEQKI